MKKVGYFFDEGKTKRLKFDDYLKQFKPLDFEYKKVNFADASIEPEDFDLIVHKYNDLFVISEEESSPELKRARKFLTSGMPVIDPIPNVKVLFNRFEQFTMVKKYLEESLELQNKVYLPNFCIIEDNDSDVSLNRMLKADVRFPIVCKPIVAHGRGAHEMCIVFNKDGLKDIPPPMVAQTFINHNAILTKVFVVGSAIQTSKRPSLKNFFVGKKDTLFFHSLSISKQDSKSELNKLDENGDAGELMEPDNDILLAIGRQLRDSLRLDLIGIDVIMDISSQKYCVIDVNTFPGYEMMTDFYHHFEQLIRDKLQLSTSARNECRTNSR